MEDRRCALCTPSLRRRSFVHICRLGMEIYRFSLESSGGSGPGCQKICRDGSVDFYAVGEGKIWEQKALQSTGDRTKSNQLFSDHKKAEEASISLHISSPIAEELKDMDLEIRAELSHGNAITTCKISEFPSTFLKKTTSADESSPFCIPRSSQKECQASTECINRDDQSPGCPSASKMKAKTSSSSVRQLIKEPKLRSPAPAASKTAPKNHDDPVKTPQRKTALALMHPKRNLKAVSNHPLSHAIRKLFTGNSNKENVSPKLLSDDPTENKNCSQISSINKGCMPLKIQKEVGIDLPERDRPHHSLQRQHSSEGFSVTKAHLYCAERDGSSSYTFLIEHSQDLLISMITAGGMPIDITFGFYSCKNLSNTKLNCENRHSFESTGGFHLATMKVSCKFNTDSCCLASKQSMELDFVLLEEGRSMFSPSAVPPPLDSSKSVVSSKLAPLRIAPSWSMTAAKKLETASSFDPKLSTMPLLFDTCSPLRFGSNAKRNSDRHFRSLAVHKKLDLASQYSELAAMVIQIPCNATTLFGSSTKCSFHSNSADRDLLTNHTKKQSDLQKKSLEPVISETSSADERDKGKIKNACMVCQRSWDAISTTAREGRGEQGGGGGDLTTEVVGSNLVAALIQKCSPESICSMNVILPSGDHGRPTNGSCGPQPLVNRWRSGGKCDCGSWDLGCGFRVLNGQAKMAADNQTLSTESSDGRRISNSKTSKSFPTVFFQAQKEEGIIMSIAQESEELVSVEFEAATITPLQAFASAVAVLHTRKHVLLQ